MADASFGVLIACRYLDTDYNEERFFVRHVYILGARRPPTARSRWLSRRRTESGQSLASAWGLLHSSQPPKRPASLR
jgi:hypothetical protein